MKKLLAGLLVFGCTSSFGSTITSFKEVRWLNPSEDQTVSSEVSNNYLEGYGTVYFVTFSGATCESKAKVPAQAGGVHIRDEHIELVDGQLTELNGVLYICSRKLPPQKQQIRSSR